MRSFQPLTVVLAAALALTACSKTSTTTTTTETDATATSAAATMAAESPAATAPAQSPGAASPAAGNGATIFATNCSSCHQADGKGVAGAFPPLVGNPTVNGDPKTVIHIVKYGLTGKISVGGHDYNGIMPPWGTHLSNADIADVITYVRGSWGNTGSPVTEADVAGVQK
jgi:mono/diheme cytochrome c family protein